MTDEIFVSKILHIHHVHIKFNFFFWPFRFHHNNGLSDLLIQTVPVLTGLDRLVFDLGQQQDISCQVGKPSGVKKDFADVLLLLFWYRHVIILQQSCITLNSTDGSFEFVGNIGNKVCLQNLRCFQFLDHQVEIRINIPDFLHLLFRFQSDGKIAFSNLLHGFFQL